LLPVLVLACGVILDQIIGDPPGWPHPVALIGKLIAWLETRINLGTSRQRRWRGAVMAGGLVGAVYSLIWWTLHALSQVNPIMAVVVEACLISMALAGKSLVRAGYSVLEPLTNGDLSSARARLSWYVSRDTDQLTEAEIARGTVETLAENFVDGILSPLFYALIGGAPLAWAFKTISTLDSMIGYRNERYRNFGWFAARADDWANYLPARLGAVILLAAGYLLGMPVRRASRIWRRDARRHPSPNGGNPESVVAGLLGVQLGGLNVYHGRIEHRAEMGDPLRPLSSADIHTCARLVRLAAWLAFAAALLVLALYRVVRL